MVTRALGPTDLRALVGKVLAVRYPLVGARGPRYRVLGFNTQGIRIESALNPALHEVVPVARVAEWLADGTVYVET